MPKHLLERVHTDSIREFRLAAIERFIDGERAEASGRRTAAIYLWGYAAEMTLKAAYFAAFGFAPNDPITFKALDQAWNAGRVNYSISWANSGKFHNVRAWADLLVAY